MKLTRPSLRTTVPAAATLTALGALVAAGLPGTVPVAAPALAGTAAGSPAGPAAGSLPGPAAGSADDRAVAAGLARPGQRPNVLMVTVDDMTVGDLRYMPRLTQHVVRQGTQLTQGMAPTPICVPARASLLTGQYAHNHGALTIEGTGGGFRAFDDRNTLPVWLRRAGYETHFAGKYLNGYGMSNPRYVPPGWSDWRGSVDMTTYAFYGTRYNVNGQVGARAQHNSDVLSGYTTDVIGTSSARQKPWFMWVNYVAPHHGGRHESDDPAGVDTTMPAARHRDMFRHLPLPADREMFVGGGSPFAGAPVSGAKRAAYREAHQQRIESLQSVDEAVGRAVAALRRTGQLSNTYLVFASDNGFLTGHHNRFGKLIPYDRSVRVPMIVAGPGIRRGAKVSTPTTNPDLAVTIAAIAGARPGRRVDGVNMLPYWRSRKTYDRVVPLEAYPVKGGRGRIYSGIRHGQWTYALLPSGREVLFDRATDPAELRSVARRPRYAKQLRTLRRLNREYRNCAGATCPGPETFTRRG